MKKVNLELLEFLLSLLNQQESTDKMKVGAYVFDYCGSTILVNIDSDGDIILVNIDSDGDIILVNILA